MKKLLLSTAVTLASLTAANADIVSTMNLNQITAPPTVGANFLINQNLGNQVIFAEQKGVTLAAPLVTDTGTIAAGTVVDSYFFAVNSSIEYVVNTSVTFSSAVLGIVYKDGPDPYGQNPGVFNPLFDASNFLGKTGTTYAFDTPACGTFCGFEIVPAFDMDTASFNGDVASFHNDYSIPGDFARIIVADPVGVPGPIAGAGLPGLLAGVMGILAWLRRRNSCC